MLFPRLIRIHHECEGVIEKSVPGISALHIEACGMMTGTEFLSCTHTNNRYFFLAQQIPHFYLIITVRYNIMMSL